MSEGSLLLLRVADLAAERTKKSQLRGTEDEGVSAATSDKRRRDKFTMGRCEIDKHEYIRSHEREWIKSAERGCRASSSRRKERAGRKARQTPCP